MTELRCGEHCGEGTIAKLIVKFTQVCKGARITKKTLQKTWLRGSDTKTQDKSP